MTTATATDINTDDQPSIATERTWQDAVCTLIDHASVHGSCFSSGELARALRVERADFRFAVTELGEFVKDLFHQGAIEYRDRHGQVTAAVQVPRRTDGRSRTPAGTEVFVYAPTPVLGQAHDFEVEIPRPGFTPTALERQRFAAAAAQANAEMVASVHGDGRLCIPRRAFEQLSHATGVSIRGGDKIWVGVELGAGETLRVYLEQRDGCDEHGLQPDRGRVRFTAPASLTSFTPGARFAIEVDGDGLSIALDPLDG
ncbi:hypothetical protein ENSA5_22930 [Enhygromyxa salina]|uniref:Uncharacterized protein n=1 Tax=Enhygromyxa salina TaxID=215803 RepID=A0A2S9YBJ4_9BACT|nr:hypothetical protein [Enhygromyxa salina]PRQ02475.1 hypothetical protein ENSA5_22930 [Enhygromyxa salina]